MSFRTYSPNPTLQRLRTRNEKDSALTFTIVEDDSFIAMEANDNHTISDYGCLVAPHSFAESTHGPKRARYRRSGAHVPTHSITTSFKENVQQDVAGSKCFEPEASLLECSTNGDAPKYLLTKPSASICEGEIHSTGGPMITGRPVFISEDAVILKAKWERLSRATPRKVRIQRKTIIPVEPVDS